MGLVKAKERHKKEKEGIVKEKDKLHSEVNQLKERLDAVKTENVRLSKSSRSKRPQKIL